MKNSWLIGCVVIFTIARFEVIAQTEKGVEEWTEEKIKESIESADKSVGSVPVARQDSLFNGGEIIAGSDKKNASFKYVPNLGFAGFSITVSTPLDSGGNDTDFYSTDTDAFADATSVTLNIRSTMLIDPQPINLSSLLFKCTEDPEMFGFKVDVKADADAETKAKAKDEAGQKCFDQKLDDLVKKVDKTKEDDEFKDIVSNFKYEQAKPFLFYGATSTYSRKEFKYFLNNSAQTEKSTENPWGLSAYVSYVKPTQYMATLTLEYQKGYETDSNGKISTRCSTPAEPSYIECVNARLGAPKLETNKNLKLSFRKPLNVAGQIIAISPEFVFDFEDRAKAWSIPVYLFGNGEGGLTGGVRYDRDSSNEKGGVYSLFVGSKFDL